jgi:hypothetical protein
VKVQSAIRCIQELAVIDRLRKSERGVWNALLAPKVGPSIGRVRAVRVAPDDESVKVDLNVFDRPVERVRC